MRLLHGCGGNLIRDYAVQAIIEDVSATDEDVQAFYDENLDKFALPEKVRARHILVENEEDAVKILAEIQGGKPFAEAAKESSICPSKEEGGDLGFFGKGQMVPEFETVAFALETGEMSDPVKTQFGWHIIMMEEKQPSSVVPLEDVAGGDQEHGYPEKAAGSLFPEARRAARRISCGDRKGSSRSFGCRKKQRWRRAED